MARIDRTRLEWPDFGTMALIPVRYVDLDSLGHVNNAAGAIILQEARALLWRDAALPALPAGTRKLVAAQTIEYAAELFYPGVVEVRSDIVELRRTSLVVGQIARQHGRPALFAENVLVLADASGPIAWPDAIRAAVAL